MKIGNKIILTMGSFDNRLNCEAGRVQVVDNIIDNFIYTKFIDTGDVNAFSINSPYYEFCNIFDSDDRIIYSNGVPFVWEDVI
jgi:hypothetical protein